MTRETVWERGRPRGSSSESSAPPALTTSPPCSAPGPTVTVVGADAVARLVGDGTKLNQVVLRSGTTIAATAAFVKAPVIPRSSIARQAGCQLDIDGYILSNDAGATSHPLVWAAAGPRHGHRRCPTRWGSPHQTAPRQRSTFVEPSSPTGSSPRSRQTACAPPIEHQPQLPVAQRDLRVLDSKMHGNVQAAWLWRCSADNEDARRESAWSVATAREATVEATCQAEATLGCAGLHSHATRPGQR